MIETDSGCDYVARGMTEEELWKDATEHIVKAHGMKIEDITLQLKTIINDTSNIPKIPSVVSSFPSVSDYG